MQEKTECAHVAMTYVTTYHYDLAVHANPRRKMIMMIVA